MMSSWEKDLTVAGIVQLGNCYIFFKSLGKGWLNLKGKKLPMFDKLPTRHKGQLSCPVVIHSINTHTVFKVNKGISQELTQCDAPG